ncbi:hypothetical protein TcCL_ESM10865 [Trypanosoma cruzi]|nr:hypothetical protein TcCL_ESM10865 [Trypanosoma cruzi]
MPLVHLHCMHAHTSIKKIYIPHYFLPEIKPSLSLPNLFSYFRGYSSLRRAASLPKSPDDIDNWYWRTFSLQNPAISQPSSSLTLLGLTTSHLCQPFIGVLSACCT